MKNTPSKKRRIIFIFINDNEAPTKTEYFLHGLEFKHSKQPDLAKQFFSFQLSCRQLGNF